MPDGRVCFFCSFWHLKRGFQKTPKYESVCFSHTASFLHLKWGFLYTENMLTHDLHGPHAVIINMDLRVHGHVLYKRRHACSTTTNGCLGWLNHGSTMAQHDCWKLTRVHEHAGSGATHLSLVAHHPLSIDMLPHGLYVTRVPPIGVVLALC